MLVESHSRMVADCVCRREWCKNVLRHCEKFFFFADFYVVELCRKLPSEGLHYGCAGEEDDVSWTWLLSVAGGETSLYSCLWRGAGKEREVEFKSIMNRERQIKRVIDKNSDVETVRELMWAFVSIGYLPRLENLKISKALSVDRSESYLRGISVLNIPDT